MPGATRNSRYRDARGLALGILSLVLAAPGLAHPIAASEVLILGVRLEVSPGTITAPKGAPILLGVSLLNSDDADVSDDFALHAVRADFSGPGVDGTEVIETIPGETLQIGTDATAAPSGVVVGRPLLVGGNYVVENIRLVDSGGATVLVGTPSVVPIRIVDRVTVQSIESRPLTSQEILERERGIVIDDDNFSVYRFSFGIETLSLGVLTELDVVLPQDDELRRT